MDADATPRRGNPISTLLLATALAVGAGFLINFWIGKFAVLGHENQIHWTIRFSIGLMTVGIWFTAWVRKGKKFTGKGWSIWVPAGLIIFGAFINVFLWRSFTIHHHSMITEAIHSQGTAVKEMVEMNIESRMHFLELMAQRWTAQRGTSPEELEFDLKTLMRHQPGFESIEWVDSMNRPLSRVFPETRRPDQREVLVSDKERQTVTQMARDRGKTVIAPSAGLDDGEKAFLICVPISQGGNTGGFFIGRVDIPEFLGTVFNNLNIPGFHMVVSAGETEIYSHGTPDPEIEKNWSQEFAVRIPGNAGWRIRLWPGAELLALLDSHFPEFGLLAGFFLIFFIGFTVFLWQEAMWKAGDLKNLNIELESEISERKRMEKSLQETHDSLEIRVRERTAELSITNRNLWEEVSRRKNAEDWNLTRLRYEKGLSEFSRNLLRGEGPLERLADAIQPLLGAAEADRIYIFENQVSPENEILTGQICEVCREGIVPQIDNPVLKKYPYSRGFQRWVDRLSSGEIISGPVDSFPVSERPVLESQGILSLLVIPILLPDGGWYGFIGFDDCTRRRDWMEEDVRLLKSAGDILGNYIEKDRSDRALEEAVKNYRDLYQDAPIGYFTSRQDQVIFDANEVGLKMLGFLRDEIIHTKCIRNFILEDSLERYETRMNRIVAGEAEKFGGLELPLRKKDGQRIYVIMDVSVVREPGGRILNFRTVMTDITEHKFAHEALVRMDKLATIGTMASGVAHEVLNPLNIIGTIVQTMEFDTNSEGKEDLEEILKQVRRASKILNNLRMFSRPKSQEIVSINIPTLFDEVASLREKDLNLDNIQIERRVEKNLPAIKGDGDQLAQVFLNLINNARDAMESRKAGTILFQAEREGGELVLQLTDDGSGIPKEIQNQIFYPFFSTKEKTKGTGLGLWVTQSIIANHGGTIRVVSEPGKGATFIIRLPIDLKTP